MPPPKVPQPNQANPPSINVTGWYSVGEMKEILEDYDRVTLSKLFVYSIRRFDPRNLEVTTLQKIAGTFFSPIVVRGVIDLDNKTSPFAFFIQESEVAKLAKLIKSYRKKYP